MPKSITPVEQTDSTPEPETQTLTPNDLSATLSKTEDALTSIKAQIADLQVNMRSRRARLDELEALTLESSQLVTHLRDQVQEAEIRLSRARIAANIAKGGLSEKATAANVKTLTTDLAALQQDLTDAQLKYSMQNTQARVESDSIAKQLEEDQKTLEALQGTLSELKAEKQERKEALGQATYTALADEMRGLLEAERKREEALAEQRAERLARQESIAERLADWPELAALLEEELTPLDEKPAPEPSPTAKTTRALLKYIDCIQKYGMQLEIPQQTSRVRVVQLISLPENFVTQAYLPQGKALVEQRRYEIEQYQRQVEEQERDRAAYRDLGLYNRGR